MRILKSTLATLVSAILLAALFSTLSLAAAPDRIPGAITSGPTVALRGNVHRNALPQFDQGPVDPAMHLGTLTLMIPPTAAQQKAINQLLAEQQDRKSANYHKWLTPEQYADRFGLSTNDMQKMAAWLKSKGFTMIYQARGRNFLTFSGTAAQAESAFGTQIHRYNVNGELHYANVKAPAVPAAMAGVVTGIRGLHDFLPHPMGVRRNKGVHPDYYSSAYQYDFIAPGDVATIYDINALYTAGIDGSGQKLAVMGRTDVYLADINDFRTGFGLTAISSTDCATSSTGVIQNPCNDPLFKYVLDGTDPGVQSNTGDLSEADLDIEWSGAVARGAQIIYVNSTDTFTSFHYAVDQVLAPVISLSYGTCEFGDNNVLDPTTGQPGSDEAELQTASLEGITFVNSSGDSGAAECDSSSTVIAGGLAVYGLAVSYPASSPQVTGVGGTALPLANLPTNPTYWTTSTGTDGNSVVFPGPSNGYIPEQVWNDDAEIADYCLTQLSSSDPGYLFCHQGGNPAQSGWVPITNAASAQADIGLSSSGGGASNCAKQTTDFSSCVSGFPQPSWQTVTITGQTTRMSPDVSFLATPNFPGYIFCTELSELSDSGTGSSCAPGGAAGITDMLTNLNNPSLIGGTSVSAPIFAGVVTLLNQYLNPSSSVGNVNQMLYSLASTPANGAFHPVTTGNNMVSCEEGQPSTMPPAYQCPSSGASAGVIGFDASNSDTTTGYNLVAGLGSVDVNNLATAWAATLPAGFTFTPTASSYQVAQGSSINATFTVAMNGGFNGTVTFACPSPNPVPESTCTAPPSINATGGVSFSFTTTPATSAALRPAQRTPRIFYAASLPSLLGIMLVAGSRRRSLGSLRFLALVVMLGFSTLWLASCGGGSSNSGGGGSTGGTTPGTYSVTVTATSGATVSSQTVSIVVQ